MASPARRVPELVDRAPLSRDLVARWHMGTCVCDRLRALVRESEGRDSDPAGEIIDARSVRATPTVTSFDHGRRRRQEDLRQKGFGLVDTIGLLLAITVMVASTSDNAGGIAVFNKAQPKSDRFAKVWVDAGFKMAFALHRRARHVAVEVVNRIHPHAFVVLPRRWVVERTWSWTMANRRLQVDYERDPNVTDGFIWAAHSRLLLHRLTQT